MSLFHILVPSQAENTSRYHSGTQVLREGFLAFAAWLPPLWALSNKMWLEFTFWIVFVVGLYFAGDYIGPNIFWIYVLSAIWLGYEAQNLKMAALERRNFVSKGTLIAASADLAEMEWLRLSMKNTPQQDNNVSVQPSVEADEDFTGVQA